MFSVGIATIIADFVLRLGYFTLADLVILEKNNSWSSANSLCTLSTSTVEIDDTLSSTSLLQDKFWTGRREKFTDWMVLENCNNYTLHNKSQEFEVEGQSSVSECRNRCAGLYFNRPYIRFGLTIRGGKDICICDDPSAMSNFGTISERCELVKCRGVDGNDFCGENGCLVVYYSDSTLSFIGTGDCSAFRRESERTFVGVAVPCSQRLGYLAEDESTGEYTVMNRVLKSWNDTVSEEGIGHKNPRMSNRVRPYRSAWSGISLSTWPVGVSFWVAVTRRFTQINMQEKQCKVKNCFCVAVQIQNDSVNKELLDCDTELPSLCDLGSIDKETPLDVTASNPSYPPNEGFHPAKFAVLVPIAVIIVFIIGVVLYKKRVCNMRIKKRPNYQGSVSGPRVESIYYSEIKAEDTSGSGFSRQNSSKHETTDEDDYDLIPDDVKGVPPKEEEDHIYDFVT